MKFLADIHLHSRWSRATARDLTPETLHKWAMLKGLSVIGSADFTHPAWLAELQDKLVPAEHGLLRLRSDLLDGVEEQVPPSCRREVRFLLSVEVSSIYKAQGHTRKVHNVICLPGFDEVTRLNDRLGRIGNLASDGRPILGLDCRSLLEIVLETCSEALFIPAHIWTPHFSALGSRSGFDSLEECYQDLLPHIFALETGLSSDPPMNRRLSALDRFAIISNSDAHSAHKLGREATCFNTELSYPGIYDALRDRDSSRFTGTIEFHPAEGKYHLDGHRKCGVCLLPQQTRAAGGQCPQCGQQLTAGVLNRVEALADRRDDDDAPTGPPHEYLIPLEEVIAASVGVGPRSKKVQGIYHHLLQHLGPELEILRNVDTERIAVCGHPLIAEAVRRTRSGQVDITAGYDGQYGVVRIFLPEERDRLMSNGLVVAGTLGAGPQDVAAADVVQRLARETDNPARVEHLLQSAQPFAAAGVLSTEQQASLQMKGPIAIDTGIDSDSNRWLAGRVEWLVSRQAVPISKVAIVTHSLRAGQRLQQRLANELGLSPADMTIGTVRKLALDLTAEYYGRLPTLLDATEARALLDDVLGVTPGAPRDLARVQDRISQWKAAGVRPFEVADDPLAVVYAGYQERLRACQAKDGDDVVMDLVNNARHDKTLHQHLSGHFEHVLLAARDLTPLECEFVRLLSGAGAGLFVIAARGLSATPVTADDGVPRLLADYGIETSRQMNAGRQAPLVMLRSADDEVDEARTVATIVSAEIAAGARPRDVAVLTRTEGQLDVLALGLQGAGTPCRIVGEQGFLQQRGARDAVAFFRFALHPDQPLRLIEALRTGPFDIGKAALATLTTAASSMARLDEAAATLPTAAAAQVEALRRAAEGYARRAQSESAADILRVWQADFGVDAGPAFQRLAAVASGHARLAGLLETLLVGHEMDIERSGHRSGHDDDHAGGLDDMVTLSTMHATGDLRYRLVVVCGVEDGLLPLRSEQRQISHAHERRLFHAAVGLASERVVLTGVRRRTVDGVPQDMAPSPFLSDLPDCAELDAQTLAAGLLSTHP